MKLNQFSNLYARFVVCLFLLSYLLSWANVNNPEGVATVQKAYIDEDGDQAYDLKYVVGGRCRGVLHEYLRPYKFE